MRKIKSAQLQDFNDVQVRRLDGMLSQVMEHAQQAKARLNQIREENPYITLAEVYQDQDLDFALRNIAQFKWID